MQSELQSETRKKFRFDPPAKDEQLSLIGLAVAKWACIEAELAQVAHGLANGDPALWREFNFAQNFTERRTFIDQHSEKLRYECASQLRWETRSAEASLRHLQKLLLECWSRPSGWITLCLPARPPRWMPHFPIGCWKLKNRDLIKALQWIDKTHNDINAMNARYAEPNAQGEITGSESIRKMFMAPKETNP